jgi:hypothetical protein
MKRFIGFFLACLILWACNTQDDESTKVRDTLVGHWVYSSMELNGSDILSNMDYQIEMELKSDSTFIRLIGEVKETGTWMLVNDTTILITPDFSELGGQELHLTKLSEQEVQYLIRTEETDTEVRVTLQRVEKGEEE